MKQKNEKPPEQFMRFFTLELYLHFNSRDDEEADLANDEWEKAIQQYKRHLKKFRDQLPVQIRKLTEIYLHDSEVLSRVEEIQAGGSSVFQEFPFPFALPVWLAVAIVTVKDDEKCCSLIYCLWDRIRTQTYEKAWPFSKEREHWLYDELDIVSNQRGPFSHGAYLHRILLSTGVVMEIPFTSVVVREFSLHLIESAQ